MVVAKTDQAHRALSRAVRRTRPQGPLERGYLAFVWGAPDRPKGTIDAPLDRHPHARDKRAVREGGRAAVTHWRVLERYRRRRRQAGREPARPAGWRPAAPTRSACIWPISAIRSWATTTYGTGFKTKASLLGAEARAALAALGRQALHAYLLAIEHPETGRNPGVPIGTAGRSASFTTCLARQSPLIAGGPVEIAQRNQRFSAASAHGRVTAT